MAENWVSPLGDIWRELLGGEPNWAQMGKQLKGLQDDERLPARWRYYLTVKREYASPAIFARSYGLWEPPASPLGELRGDPGPVVDADGVLTAYGDTLTRPR